MENELNKRIITSFFLIIIFLVIIYAHRFVFGITLLIFSFVACIEFNNIIRKLVGDLYSHSKKFNLKFFALMWIPFIYMFFIFSLLTFDIYKLEGPTFFLFISSICIFTDIGGYVVGKTIGGIKLTKISPNKTLSGSIGSFLFSIIPLIIFTRLDNFQLNFDMDSLIFCLQISLVSQIGDLFLSFLKRKAKIKDTGKILPGHGGILDRADGIIFAIPFSNLLLNLT
tara:strand:+ start:1226 stop:1903 length:678 start_codon:yes stop_codon:yes gene_type:complete